MDISVNIHTEKEKGCVLGEKWNLFLTFVAQTLILEH